jgi:hypothetical protein
MKQGAKAAGLSAFILCSAMLGLSGCGTGFLARGHLETLTNPPQLTVIVPTSISTIYWRAPQGRGHSQGVSSSQGGDHSSVEISSDGSLHDAYDSVRLWAGFPWWGREPVFYDDEKKNTNHLYILRADAVSGNDFDYVYRIKSSAKTYVVEKTNETNKENMIHKYRPLAYFELINSPAGTTPVPAFSEEELFKFLAAANSVLIQLEFDSPYTQKAENFARKTGRPDVDLLNLKTGERLTELNMESLMYPQDFAIFSKREIAITKGKTLSRLRKATGSSKTDVIPRSELLAGFRNKYGSTINFKLHVPEQELSEEKIWVDLQLYGALTSPNTVDFNIIIQELRDHLEKAIRASSSVYQE